MACKPSRAALLIVLAISGCAPAAPPLKPAEGESKRALCRELATRLPGFRGGDTRNTQDEVAAFYDLFHLPEICGDLVR